MAGAGAAGNGLVADEILAMGVLRAPEKHAGSARAVGGGQDPLRHNGGQGAEQSVGDALAGIDEHGDGGGLGGVDQAALRSDDLDGTENAGIGGQAGAYQRLDGEEDGGHQRREGHIDGGLYLGMGAGKVHGHLVPSHSDLHPDIDGVGHQLAAAVHEILELIHAVRDLADGAAHHPAGIVLDLLHAVQQHIAVLGLGAL